ncbi:MAG: NERD domain-containing protein [Gallionellaceae bacterium]|nr:NERD domain-containing protein [Gallionellaceae bacterium]
MATLIPSLGAARFDARGELRLAERLKDCLEDNAWVWHNIPVGPFGRHPDFVALHPQQGIVVLEARNRGQTTVSQSQRCRSRIGFEDRHGCKKKLTPVQSRTLVSRLNRLASITLLSSSPSRTHTNSAKVHHVPRLRR